MEKKYLNLNRSAWKNILAHEKKSHHNLFFQKTITGSLFSICGGMQKSIFHDELKKDFSDGHLIITGHWRSGTTYLHNLLALDPQFTFPSTASCMNPHLFMLGARNSQERQVKRPMDDMLINSASPQEDEFALLAMGVRSPYEAFLFPCQLKAALSLADPCDLTERERVAWEDAFLFFTQGTSLLGGKRPVILKSPTHTYRAKAIAALFPGAKFVSIKRNPLEVFESTFRMWKKMFDLYAVGDHISDNELRQIILENRIDMESKFSQAAENLPKEKVAYVAYERLVSDPLSELKKLYLSLEIDSSFLNSDLLAAKIEKGRSYIPTGALPPADWQRQVESTWAKFF